MILGDNPEDSWIESRRFDSWREFRRFLERIQKIPEDCWIKSRRFLNIIQKVLEEHPGNSWSESGRFLERNRDKLESGVWNPWYNSARIHRFQYNQKVIQTAHPCYLPSSRFQIYCRALLSNVPLLQSERFNQTGRDNENSS